MAADDDLWYKRLMRKTSRAKPAQRSEEDILDEGVQQLLRATKAHAKKKGRPIDAEQLRKDGFSERFIQKVEEA
jgi:hypothetical protein